MVPTSEERELFALENPTHEQLVQMFHIARHERATARRYVSFLVAGGAISLIVFGLWFSHIAHSIRSDLRASKQHQAAALVRTAGALRTQNAHVGEVASRFICLTVTARRRSADRALDHAGTWRGLGLATGGVLGAFLNDDAALARANALDSRRVADQQEKLIPTRCS